MRSFATNSFKLLAFRFKLLEKRVRALARSFYAFSFLGEAQKDDPITFVECDRAAFLFRDAILSSLVLRKIVRGL